MGNIEINNDNKKVIKLINDSIVELEYAYDNSYNLPESTRSSIQKVIGIFETIELFLE